MALAASLSCFILALYLKHCLITWPFFLQKLHSIFSFLFLKPPPLFLLNLLVLADKTISLSDEFSAENIEDSWTLISDLNSVHNGHSLRTLTEERNCSYLPPDNPLSAKTVNALSGSFTLFESNCDFNKSILLMYLW